MSEMQCQVPKEPGWKADAIYCTSVRLCNEKWSVSKQFLRVVRTEVAESKRQNLGLIQQGRGRSQTASKMLIYGCQGCTAEKALCI